MNYYWPRVLTVVALTTVSLFQATQVAGALLYSFLHYLAFDSAIGGCRAGKLVDGVYVLRYKGNDDCGGTVWTRLSIA